MKFRRVFRWLLGKPAVVGDPVGDALVGFLDERSDTLRQLRRLVAALRPRDEDDDPAVRFGDMLDRLDANAALRSAFRHRIVEFVASRKLVTFFTDSGILPGTGFFSEWWRIIGTRLLPEVQDERRLKDCLHLIFDRRDDWQWLERIPTEATHRLWQTLSPEGALRDPEWRGIEEQMLNAVLLLAHRVSGLGVEGELLRSSPNFDDDTPCFVALSAEALHFVNAYRAALEKEELQADDGSQLLVIADQCSTALQRIRKRAQTVGTSIHLSYLLTRGEQNLERLRELIGVLAATEVAQAPEAAIQAGAEFVHTALLAENRRDSLGHYVNRLSQLLAVRVTENAARAGEHYVCSTRADYKGMWRSAAAAGVLIAGMAMLKIQAASLHAPLAVEAALYSLIYGLGFVIIALGGMTVATKQPAMTAQTLAGLLGDLRPTRQADLERVADVIAAVCRSQLAAIAGNVMVALPVAIAISAVLGWRYGITPVSPEKANGLLGQLDPLSWAIPHAAIAGFYLFLSGLITGYFDNRASYTEIGPRIARLRWLRALLGPERSGRFGEYMQDRMGAIMGNFLFGCMLGSTGFIGTILGLPLDIRHIAFASANLGYALSAHHFALPLQVALTAAAGVALIGFTNLAVSFSLALRTAMNARGLRLRHWGPLLGTLWRRLRREPAIFFVPPPETAPTTD
jgi:site-specific recombinase